MSEMKHVPDITLESLKQLGVETLAQLVFESYALHPAFETRVNRLVAGATSSKALIALIKQQLTRLSSEKKFYFARESFGLAERLSETRQAILQDLAEQDVETAISLTWRFLALHRKIFERVDDSYGNISPIFDLALQQLAGLYSASLTHDGQQLAQDLFKEYDQNGYGVYDRVIEYFAPVLKESGLCCFEALLKQQLDVKPSKPTMAALSRYRAVAGLLAIADARQDVDAYVAVIEEYESPVGDDKAILIAQRLIQVQRFSEALNWLEQVSTGSRFWDRKGLLAVQALEALGNQSEAQTLRIELFKRMLTKEAYKDCLAHTVEPERLKATLLEVVMTHPSFTRSVTFLTEIKELERVAVLVQEHESQWDGSHYTLLQPIAKAMEVNFPLESSILYRALVAGIVTRGQSKYYAHAVRYLKILEQLSLQIKDWQTVADHAQYFLALREQHKRKTALWSQYQIKGVGELPLDAEPLPETQGGKRQNAGKTRKPKA
jgi:hypothetical protein